MRCLLGLAVAAVALPGLLPVSAGAAVRCPTKTEPKQRCPTLKQVVPIRSNGTVGLDAAKKAFAATVAPLPDVRPPKGGYPYIRSGTGPTGWLLRHWSKLTAAQQAAVRKALPGIKVPRAGPSALGTASSVRSAAAPRARAAKYSLQDFKELADQAKKRLNERFNPDLTLTYNIQLGPAEDAGAIAYLDQLGVCQIIVTPNGQSGDLTFARELMLHELTHCYQNQLDPTTGQQQIPWIDEGSAEWVAAVVGKNWSTKVSASIQAEYKIWFTNFKQPLQLHSYSAIGFFGHLAHSSSVNDVFQDLPIAYKSPDLKNQAYDVLVGTNSPFEKFLRTTAPSGTRLEPLGKEWVTSGAGLPGPDQARYDPPSVSVGTGSLKLKADGYGHTVNGLNAKSGSQAFELEVDTPDTARGLLHHDDGDHDLRQGDRSFCLREPDECKCPNGTTIQPLGEEGYLALHGYKKKAKVTLEAQTLEEACKQTSTNLHVGGAFNMAITMRGACGHRSTEKPATISALFNKTKKTPPYQVGGINITAGAFKSGTYDQHKGDAKGGRVIVTKYGEPGGMAWGNTIQRRDPPLKPLPYPGSVTVDYIDSKRRVYGTVNATLGAGLTPDSVVHVSGRWSCEPYDLILPPGVLPPKQSSKGAAQ